MGKMSLLERLMCLRDLYKEMSQRAKEDYEKIKTEGQTDVIYASDKEMLVLRNTQADNYKSYSEMLNILINEYLNETTLGENVWVEVLKPFGYYIEDHPIGEVMQVDLAHVNDLVKDGYAKIVVNNFGENSPNDKVTESFDPFEVQPDVE